MGQGAQGPRRVALIEGDGAGPELVGAVATLLATVVPDAVVDTVDLGPPGDAIAEAALERMRAADLVVKGPIATAQDGRARSRNVELRAALDVRSQVRRIGPLRSGGPAPEVLVIRETREGLFSGVGVAAGSAGATRLADVLAELGAVVPPDAAMSIKWATPAATASLWRAAVEVALAHGRRRLWAVHKAAAVPHADRLLLEVGREVVVEESDRRGVELELRPIAVDAACARLAQRDPSLDVLVTTNLYGDICSDVAGAAADGVPTVAGVNLGDGPPVAEAAHGAVLRHAGRGTASPFGLLLSTALALELGGWPDLGRAVTAACVSAVADGAVTPDLAEPGRPALRTHAVAESVAAIYASNASSSRSATGSTVAGSSTR